MCAIYISCSANLRAHTLAYNKLRGVEKRSTEHAVGTWPALDSVDALCKRTTKSTGSSRCVLPMKGLGYAVRPSCSGERVNSDPSLALVSI